jgi:murein DD-endopeptidase MepM/ murein hydrolase activator NlpD
MTGIATGPHLDYRMSRAGRFVNPLTVSLPRKDGVGADELPVFSAIRAEYGAILSCRFVRQEGCYPLDVETRESAHAAATSEAPADTRKVIVYSAGLPGS